MKNKFLKLIFPVWAMILFSIPVLAQPGEPPIDDDPIEPAPIDNWALMLIFIGIILGIYLLLKLPRKAIS